MFRWASEFSAESVNGDTGRIHRSTARMTLSAGLFGWHIRGAYSIKYTIIRVTSKTWQKITEDLIQLTDVRLNEIRLQSPYSLRFVIVYFVLVKH